MNDRFDPPALDAPTRPAGAAPDLALAVGTRLGDFEIREVIARGASTVVYLAIDHLLLMPVAIQEYLPGRLVQRDPRMQLVPIDAWHEDVVLRGLRAFIEEARMLAPLDHPALVKVRQLFEANGSAYRVMPLCPGQRLSDLRQAMVGAPDEPSLRALLDDLLGALDTLHRTGKTHGAVTPSNILLLADDRPLLLGPGAASLAIGSDLVDSLMATIEPASAARAASVAVDGSDLPPVGVARDLYALAETMRFCIAAELLAARETPLPRVPLAELLKREFPSDRRPNYSAALIDTLDAAVADDPLRRPRSVAQFREWLRDGVPPATAPARPRSNGWASTSAHAPAPASASAPAPASPAAPPTPTAATVPRAAAPAGPRAASDAAPLHPAPPAAASVPEPFRFDHIEPHATVDARTEPAMPEPGHAALWARLAAESKANPPGAARATPPLLPPSLRRDSASKAPRRRFYKVLLVATLGAAAVTGLGFATGGWNAMPALTLDAPLLAHLAATPPSPPDLKRAPPAIVRAADESRAAAAGAAAVPASVRPTPTAAEAIAPPAADPPPPVPALRLPAATPAATPAAMLTARPPAAGPAPKAGTAPARVAAVNTAANAPRAACAGRTEFALYRCMRQQCGSAQWSAHAQCVKLRSTDLVD